MVSLHYIVDALYYIVDALDYIVDALYYIVDALCNSAIILAMTAKRPKTIQNIGRPNVM